MVIQAAAPIELNLFEQLHDRGYRQRFFLAESSAHIARQLIELRKRRGLNQKEVAERVGTQQPAISRIERADYQNWSFTTLRKIAGELDARIRVLIEPSEDILHEYKNEEAREATNRAAHRTEPVFLNATVQPRGFAFATNLQIAITSHYPLAPPVIGQFHSVDTEKDEEIARLRAEIESWRAMAKLRVQEQITPLESMSVMTWLPYTNQQPPLTLSKQ